jgi:hypothetical protein
MGSSASDPSGSALSGGNIAVFITDGGVSIVDAKLPGFGPTIVERVKSVDYPRRKRVTIIDCETLTEGPAMSTDRYTKTILTVIAACLIYLCLGRPAVLPAVQAQTEPTRVILAGWSQAPNTPIVSLGSMPLPVGGLDTGGIVPILVREQR